MYQEKHIQAIKSNSLKKLKAKNITYMTWLILL